MVGVPGESTSRPTTSFPIPSMNALIPARPWKCASVATNKTDLPGRNCFSEKIRASSSMLAIPLVGSAPGAIAGTTDMES